MTILTQEEFKTEILKDTRAQLARGIWGFLNQDVKTCGSRKDPAEKILSKGTCVRITYLQEDKVGISRGNYPGFEALVDLDSFEHLRFEGR